jgi:hypothetical protein
LVRPADQAREEEAPGTWGLHLRAVQLVDQQATGVEAVRLLIPADWAFEGGVQWRMASPVMPASIAFRAYNPQGPEAFELFPSILCYWTNNPMLTSMVPPGGVYYGAEVRPPLPALQALQELVVPRYRGAMPGLQLAQREHLPELARELRTGSPVDTSAVTESDGGRVRIRYQQGGRGVDEDIFGIVEHSRQAMPTMMGMMEQIFWIVDYVYSFRATAGTLEGLSDTFVPILRSLRLNPAWYARYRQVSQFMIQNQIQQIQHVGQISQIISRTGDQISDMVMEGYNQRQATLDRLSAQFSQAVRGVDEYRSPFGDRGVELPGGYRHAWANALGEYVVTDDPNFDPNVGSTQNWEPLERR